MIRRGSRWPFRQDDPRWAADKMWDRSKVMAVHRRFNGASSAKAMELLHEYPHHGNTIRTEGCLVTSLAMVLRLLHSQGNWTPPKLNRKAKEGLYYTEAGLSMVPLYADLLVDVTNGDVQLCAQEQYLSGESRWPRTSPAGCTILRGYRSLNPRDRKDFVLMLKMGTHDDTFASHYVLVDPSDPGDLDDDDVLLLDPAQPLQTRQPWTLRQSHGHLVSNPTIAREWRKVGILPLQISGVWAFGRWISRSQRSLAVRLFEAIARAENPKSWC